MTDNLTRLTRYHYYVTRSWILIVAVQTFPVCDVFSYSLFCSRNYSVSPATFYQLHNSYIAIRILSNILCSIATSAEFKERPNQRSVVHLDQRSIIFINMTFSDYYFKPRSYFITTNVLLSNSALRLINKS